MLFRSTTPSGKIPLPPTSLTVTVGAWVHTVHMTLPDDQIVSHVEIWVATASQVRDDANRIFILTVLPDDYGDTVEVKIPIANVTADYTYWVRSISFAGNHSVWCPPDSQGGYVVVGAVSVQEAIDRVLEILAGNITEDELYIDLKTKINLIPGLSDRLAAIESNLDSLETWVSGTAYSTDDVVVYNDKVYLCVLDTASPHTELPTNETYWSKIGESATLAGNIAINSLAVTLLDARIEDNEDDVIAHATLLSGLRSNVDTNEADITSEATTRATNDGANATDITTVSTQVNNATTGLPATYAAVQQTMESVDGIKAKYAVKLDVNGHVSGIELINDGTISEFGILADKFKFFMPDGSGSAKTPFVIGMVDGIATVGIDGNMVIDGTILATAIETGNLTVEHLATAQTFKGHTFESTTYEAGVTGWRIDANGNLEMPGGSITVTGGLDYSEISGDDKPADGADVSAPMFGAETVWGILGSIRVYGFAADGTPADIDGFVWIDGTKVTLPFAVVTWNFGEVSKNREGYLAYDPNQLFDNGSHYGAIYKHTDGLWRTMQEDTAVTLNATCIAIGLITIDSGLSVPYNLWFTIIEALHASNYAVPIKTLSAIKSTDDSDIRFFDDATTIDGGKINAGSEIIIGIDPLVANGDYMIIDPLGVTSKYWNGAAHETYRSLNRVEEDFFDTDNVEGNTLVVIPGIWLMPEGPKITFTPGNGVKTYSWQLGTFGTLNQTLHMYAQNLRKVSVDSLHWQFDVYARILVEGTVNTTENVPEHSYAWNHYIPSYYNYWYKHAGWVLGDTGWYTIPNSSFTTPLTTTSITTTGHAAISFLTYYGVYYCLQLEAQIVVDGTPHSLGLDTATISTRYTGGSGAMYSTVNWNSRSVAAGAAKNYYFRVRAFHCCHDGGLSRDFNLVTSGITAIPQINVTGEDPAGDINWKAVGY